MVPDDEDRTGLGDVLHAQDLGREVGGQGANQLAVAGDEPGIATNGAVRALGVNAPSQGREDSGTPLAVPVAGDAA